MKNTPKTSAEDLQFFHENGYLIKRNFVDLDQVDTIKQVVKQQLNDKVEPFELEQQVNYPGSPKSVTEKGGDTIRRLLLAYQRHPIFKQWAHNEHVLAVITKLLKADQLYVVQSHHNCVMTKQPEFSSETHWHKDIRYWHFDNNVLVNTWLPLGDETTLNGCLQVLPGSHVWNTPKDRLDERLFLRKDLPENQAWLAKSTNVELRVGDLLFFHAGMFHAAGRNHTTVSKNAVVFTYHSENNAPKAQTKSVKYNEVLLMDKRLDSH